MFYSVKGTGKYGIINDIDSYLLPPEAWSSGNNIRFRANHVEKNYGYTSYFTPSISDVSYIVPAIHWSGGSPTQYWVYAGTDYIYGTTSGITSTDLTRTAGVYTGTTNDRWNSCYNQNILYMNNGVDAPQVWANDKFEDLPWDSNDTWAEKSYTVDILRNYKNFLIGMKFDDSIDYDPMAVYWSDPAEPFSVPATWDYSLSSNSSGIQQLTNTSGHIVDGISLRDSFLIYKEDAIVNMSYIGGNYIFQFRDISNMVGMMAQNCATEIKGNHFVVANDDIIINDGLNIESIINNKIKRTIFSEISSDYYQKSFVIPNHNKEEIWFAYVTTGNTKPNKLAIWNYKEATWTFKDISNINFINAGVLFQGADVTWNADTATWNSDTSVWNEKTYNPAIKKLLGVTDNLVYEFDTGFTNNGTSYQSYVERTGIILGEPNVVKQVTAVYPKCEGIVDVYIGSTYNMNEVYTWKGPYRFDPSSDAQIRCRVTGRYHAIRFEFIGDNFHHLDGYDIEFINTGYGR